MLLSASHIYTRMRQIYAAVCFTHIHVYEVNICCCLLQIYTRVCGKYMLLSASDPYICMQQIYAAVCHRHIHMYAAYSTDDVTYKPGNQEC